MTQQERPLLVVCHEATLTGASLVAAELLEAARPQLPGPITVRLLSGGPLSGRLTALGNTADDGRPPSAVFVNSALAADVINSFPDVPILVYVHEEANALAGLPPAATIALTSGMATRILCVSERSRRALMDLGVRSTPIDVLRPVVALQEQPAGAALLRARELVGASEDTRLVVGCGEASWRKGADLFVEVARRLADRSDVRFAWIGRRPRGFNRLLDYDAVRLDETGVVRWVGEVADTRPYLAASDVLLVSSREDPQPLVPLEAALLGIPTIAFDVSGLQELGRIGASAIVPYPDTSAMARTLIDLLDDGARRADLVNRARRRASTQLPDAVVPVFVRAILALLSASREDFR